MSESSPILYRLGGYFFGVAQAASVILAKAGIHISCGFLALGFRRGDVKSTALGDGAKWIRNFFTDRLKGFPAKEFVLDWYHLAKKCYEFSSMISKGRKAKPHLMNRLIPYLW